MSDDKSMLGSMFCEHLSSGHSHSRINEFDAHNHGLHELAKWRNIDESHSVHFDTSEDVRKKPINADSPSLNTTPQARNTSTVGQKSAEASQHAPITSTIPFTASTLQLPEGTTPQSRPFGTDVSDIPKSTSESPNTVQMTEIMTAVPLVNETNKNTKSKGDDEKCSTNLIGSLWTCVLGVRNKLLNCHSSSTGLD